MDFVKKEAIKMLLPSVIPTIPDLLKDMRVAGPKYVEEQIPLERGEFAVGLIMLGKDGYVVSSCVAKNNDSNKIEIQRAIHNFTDADLVKLLLENAGKIAK